MNIINRIFTNQNNVGNLGDIKMNVDLFTSNGYKIQKISWEDCARTKNSCFGPNISDMTLITKNGELMPMIRKPNFGDVSYDINIDKFKLPTNKNTIVGLKEFLKNIGKYSNNDKLSSMYLERDEMILTQNQCCILPCNVNENVEFGVQLYNYQSSVNNPAVLTILVSSKGTSVQIIENKTVLYHNKDGSAHYYNAKRLGDVRKERGENTNDAVKDYRKMTDDELLENTLMIIQVPLKKSKQLKKSNPSLSMGDFFDTCAMPANAQLCSKSNIKNSSLEVDALEVDSQLVKTDNFDMGNISVGSYVSKYLGTKDSKLERDSDFPIRCTYQYYRLSDSSILSEDSIQNISEQLNNINTIAMNKGSLVFSDTNRTTEPIVKPIVNPNWKEQKMLNI